MSDTTESPPESPPPPPTAQPQASPDFVRDIILWKRKPLNVTILLGATVAWTLVQIYQYNFITLFSWVAMALVVCFFFWGNIHRLLKKEAPDLSELEISHETAMATADLVRHRVEDAIRLMFNVSAEREGFVFAGDVASLYMISIVARHFDLLTLCYLGAMGVMTVPVIYIKHERKIRDLGENLRTQSRRLYSVMEEKLGKLKSRIEGQHKEIKEKKME